MYSKIRWIISDNNEIIAIGYSESDAWETAAYNLQNKISKMIEATEKVLEV